MQPKIALIAAVADNGIVGNDNKMPWHISSELKYFRATTQGKPVIMGRKTFESIGKPFPKRTNIVITRNQQYSAEGIFTADSLDAALEIARNTCTETGVDEIMICGGAQIYALALAHADRLYLTEIHLTPEGDATFPAFDRSQWVETKRERRSEDKIAYSITILERRD